MARCVHRPRRSVSILDWVMLALAIVSVAMLAYETWGDPTAAQRDMIIRLDYAIIGVFALEFMYRWSRDPRPRTFVLRNWYDLLAMIPVHHPLVRGLRLFRLVRVAVILSRFGRAADRAFGEEVTYRFLSKFKGVITETVADAVTIRVMDMTLEVLQKGEYAKNMADHLEAHGDDMMAIIHERVKEDPKIGKVRHIPFFDDIVESTSRVTLRLSIDLLRDDRMDQMIKDVIKQNVEQIRSAVKENEAVKQTIRSGSAV